MTWISPQHLPHCVILKTWKLLLTLNLLEEKTARIGRKEWEHSVFYSVELDKLLITNLGQSIASVIIALRILLSFVSGPINLLSSFT